MSEDTSIAFSWRTLTCCLSACRSAACYVRGVRAGIRTSLKPSGGIPADGPIHAQGVAPFGQDMALLTQLHSEQSADAASAAADEAFPEVCLPCARPAARSRVPLGSNQKIDMGMS
jgi:hypothetical protein